MKYEVNITEKPFIKDEFGHERIRYERTAEVTLYKEDGAIDKRIERGYAEMMEIEQQIEIGNDIKLDHCFFESLMLSGRKIKSLSARNVFIGGEAGFSDV
jgi:hypothetical protein